MDASADPRLSTIYTFRDWRHLEARCKKCGEMTILDFGVITGGCEHIHVRFCEDGDGA